MTDADLEGLFGFRRNGGESEGGRRHKWSKMKEKVRGEKMGGEGKQWQTLAFPSAIRSQLTHVIMSFQQLQVRNGSEEEGVDSDTTNTIFPRFMIIAHRERERRNVDPEGYGTGRPADEALSGVSENAPMRHCSGGNSNFCLSSSVFR